MSHYDSGHRILPGMMTINLFLETYNNRIGNGWKRKFKSRKDFPFLGGKFYSEKLDVDVLSPTLWKYKLSLISNGPIKYTEKELQKLREKYDSVILDIKTNPIEFNNFPGWVHDWVKSFCLDKEKRIWSEARDTIQNDKYPFEVEWYRVYNQWCEDCRDVHTKKETILTRFYKTKRSALKASKIIPNLPKEDSRFTI